MSALPNSGLTHQEFDSKARVDEYRNKRVPFDAKAKVDEYHKKRLQVAVAITEGTIISHSRAGNAIEIEPELNDTGKLLMRAERRIKAEQDGVCSYCLGRHSVPSRGTARLRNWLWKIIYRRCFACGGSGLARN